MSKKRQPPGNARTSASSKATRPKLGGPSQAAKDRVVRVFVSSTFRDMVEDRNELMAQVWPALRKLCRARNVEFVEVDLRWGVTEEQAQRKETLEHCLAEIRRCRPYFIGLLGERYGWVPGPEAYPPELLDREDWLKREVAHRSVTELEILHGVLNDPEMAGRAFFYFRDPKYIRTVARARRKDYAAESAESTERQQRLKDRIRATCKAKGIPLLEHYAGPRTLAKRVLADLTAAIDAEFPADQVPDAWAGEDRDHEAYAKSRRTDFYVGQSSDFARLDDYACAGADGRGLVVLGESGAGKSALLANWAAQWSQAHPGDFVFQHFIGSSPMSAGHLVLMRRLMVAILRWCGEGKASGRRIAKENRIPAEAEEIVKVFPEYLDRLAAEANQRGVQAIVILDALNQFDDQGRGRLLGWLPFRLPGVVRLVVSSLPGDTLDALQPRDWPALTVKPLTLPERVRLISRYLAHFSQGLSKARARLIASQSAAANPLFLKTLLDDLRATGQHERLDAQIADYLRAKTLPALFGKILARYERDYERDRPGLVREALALIWAARRGLTEPELLDLLKMKGQKRLPAAIWSPVRCALEDGLLDRDGVLTFAHEHLRKAVERRYVSHPRTARQLRLRLANHFARRAIDARQADELPWLFQQGGARARLRACLLDIDRFLLVQERDQNELLGYWVWLKQERVMGRLYLQEFNHWQKAKGQRKQDIAYVANRLGEFLYAAALHSDAEPLIRRALAINKNICGKDHPNVATCLNNLARLYRTTNRHLEAEPLMKRALEIDERCFDIFDPTVARDINNLAGMIWELNRYCDAEPMLLRALKINEKSYGKDHPIVAYALNNLARMLQDTNRYSEAEPLLRRALGILEKSHGINHPDVVAPLSNMAALFQDTNRHSEAEAFLRRALEIDENSFGEDHPNVATGLNNLGVLLLETNQLIESELRLLRALKIDEKNFGNVHPSVARDLNSMAQLCQATNRPAEAGQYLRRALAINIKSYGKYHRAVLQNINNMAILLQETGRLTEAEPQLREALAIAEKISGKDHPNVAAILQNMAALFQNTNRYSEAETLLRRALAINEKSFGKEHPDVATALNNLAQLLQATKRLSQAEPLLQRALAVTEKSYGKDHPQVATVLNNLAQLLQARNQLSVAEPLMRRALEIFLNSLGKDHPNTQIVTGNYVDVLQAMGRSTSEVKKALGAIGKCCGVDMVNMLECIGQE